MHPAEETSTNSQGNEKRSYVDWARYWFAQLARHHRVHDPAKWCFTEEHVITFLRARLKAGVPSWKRVLIVKGLIDYRNKLLRSKYPKLEHIRAKLQQIAADDKQKVSVIPGGSTTLPSSTAGRSNARNKKTT